MVLSSIINRSSGSIVSGIGIISVAAMLTFMSSIDFPNKESSWLKESSSLVQAAESPVKISSLNDKGVQ